MFVSHDKKSNKKKFQKPNILRRKPVHNKSLIIHKLGKSQTCESQDVQSLSFVLDPKSNELERQKSINLSNVNHVYSFEESAPKADNVTQRQHSTQDVGENISVHNSLIYVNTIQQNNIQFCQNQTVNVEPVLLGDMIHQNVPVFENVPLGIKETENHGKQKWCINFIREPGTIIIKNIDNTEPGLIGYVEQKPDVPLISNPVQSVPQEPAVLQGDTITPVNNTQTISIEQFIKISTRFKCEIPGCNKDFMSKQKLNKHMTSVHNKDKIKNAKPQRQITVECPVKRVLESGVEELCGRTFHVRDELMKHLNEEHTIDEALYSCTECGRRFFWASGLRAHARAHLVRAGRAELACPWPGCGRVFRQPCRLREHSRAHTGDRPYPCSFPNCGWSFRTASKLLRHARRHTGERRHACGACGRAFLRREHLRDHAQRHAAPQRRAKHACPHSDCQQSFTNMSSLYLHMKKVHKEERSGPPALSGTADREIRRVKSDNMFVVSLLEPSEGAEIEHASVEGDWIVQEETGKLEEAGELEEVEEAGELEEVEDAEEAVELEEVEELEVGEEVTAAHAARTHCTWPLARALHWHQPSAYLLEEDVQVEQSEGSESNIYTVRSDLFLHGNMLHSEDSEQMAECTRVSESAGASEGETAASAELDADLLLDAPSVHLDQEELYTDAVDESSFRVLLLSEELA
ncbi:zinc finger protein 677-like [Maniola jurtina]|uniref:zinc finger protein 677-like n=1 Tax=Maniola jurtina TaxID=191418 RepID=UPI001E686A1C|nr:zinc finger protein 677-like [Maniola jurtina]XP_045769341.1 zinc finger protein 677-like [Maniola jurtina]